MDALGFIALILAFSSSQALICGEINQCICSGTSMECNEVPKITINERMDTELELKNLGKLDNADMEFLKGFKKVIVYGTRFCGNELLKEVAHLLDCEALEKFGPRITAPRPDLAEMVKEAVVAYLVK